MTAVFRTVPQLTECLEEASANGECCEKFISNIDITLYHMPACEQRAKLTLSSLHALYPVQHYACIMHGSCVLTCLSMLHQEVW